MPRLFIASGIFHPEPGGPSTYLAELLPELQRRGWDIRVLTYGEPVASDEPYPVTRIPRRPLPLRLSDYARAARPFLDWAELIYMHTLGLPLVGGSAPRVVKIVGDQAWERSMRRGWISPGEDIDLFESKRHGWRVNAAKTARRRELRGVDGVIVPSIYLKRMVVQWGVSPDKVQVIYNALPPEESSSQLTQADARARLQLDDTPLVLTAARLLPWKGVDHLISALQRVPEVRLLVAGDGPMRDALEAQAEHSGLGERVRFLGRVSRDLMPLYLRAADYTALYSGYEGLSHTLLESLRAGTPVIASDKGGNPEVVRDGVNGLLVPYVDVNALAATLLHAFVPGKRDVLAANTDAGMERFAFATMIETTDAALRAYL